MAALHKGSCCAAGPTSPTRPTTRHHMLDPVSRSPQERAPHPPRPDPSHAYSWPEADTTTTRRLLVQGWPSTLTHEIRKNLWSASVATKGVSLGAAARRRSPVGPENLIWHAPGRRGRAAAFQISLPNFSNFLSIKGLLSGVSCRPIIFDGFDQGSVVGRKN